MALPVSLRNSITPPELELIASEELVEIIPLISMERTAFISVRPDCPILVISMSEHGCQGAYGPLRPPNKAKLPLWIAMNLKMKKKCHIVPPDWLSVGAVELESCLRLLTRAEQNFFRIDWHRKRVAQNLANFPSALPK